MLFWYQVLRKKKIKTRELTIKVSYLQSHQSKMVKNLKPNTSTNDNYNRCQFVTNTFHCFSYSTNIVNMIDHHRPVTTKHRLIESSCTAFCTSMLSYTYYIMTTFEGNKGGGTFKGVKL